LLPLPVKVAVFFFRFSLHIRKIFCIFAAVKMKEGMDILMIILALLGIVLIPLGVVAGFGLMPGKSHNMPTRPVQLQVTEGGYGMFFVRWSTYDYGDKMYHARLEQRAADETKIVSAPSKEGLEKEVRRVFCQWQKEWPEKNGWPLELLDS